MKNLILGILVSLLCHPADAQLRNFDSHGKFTAHGKALSEASYLIIKTEPLTHFVPTVLTALIPAALDYSVTIVKAVSKNRKDSFMGEYSCSASGDNFYLKQKPNLPTLNIIRKVQFANSLEIASEMVFSPELSGDNSAFRYSLDTLVLKYTKARTKKKYDYIDIDIKIEFRSITFNMGKYEIADLRTVTMAVPMVKPGEIFTPENPVYSGWIPLVPKSFTAGKGYEAPKAVFESTVVTRTIKGSAEAVSDTISTATITKDMFKAYAVNIENSGLYEITVTVTETNPYKISAENKQHLIENTGEGTSSFIKVVSRQIFGEVEKEDEE